MPTKKASSNRPGKSSRPQSSAPSDTAKQQALEQFREDPKGQVLTTDQGLRINDDQNSLKAGARGPSLLEDFILREKITHFDHERIPERVVHARGAAAHGYFQVYKPLSRYTKAAFLQDPIPKIVAPHGGSVKADGGTVTVDFTLLTVGSVLFDAVFIPGGAKSTGTLAADGAAVLFVREAYKHCKAIAASGTGLALLEAAGIDARDVVTRREGVDSQMADAFIRSIAQHRDWSRETKAQAIPA
jgi:Catalase/C-terminal domain found in long catalases